MKKNILTFIIFIFIIIYFDKSNYFEKYKKITYDDIKTQEDQNVI